MTTNTNMRMKNVRHAFNEVKSKGHEIDLSGGSTGQGGGHVQGLCISGGYYVISCSRNDADPGDEGYFEVFHKDDKTEVRVIDSGVPHYQHVGGSQEIGSYAVVGLETNEFEDGRIWLYSL